MIWGILGGCIVCVLASLLVLRRRLSGVKPRGMKQWARSPALMRKMGNAIAYREAMLARADSLSESDLREGTESLLAGDPNTRGTWHQVFIKVGKRCEPVLLDALNDPRCRAPDATDGEPFSRSPFQTVIEVLANIGSDRALDRLVPLLKSPDEKARTTAAMNCATVGSPAAIEPTLLALQDASPQVRGYALIGLSKAKDRGQLSPQFANRVAGALRPVVAGRTDRNDFQDSDAVRGLLNLDPSAVEWLASSECLRADNPHLQHVLGALVGADASIDETLLRSVFEAAGQRTGHPWPNIRGEAMIALAGIAPESVRGAIEAGLRDPNETIRRCSADALLRLHGLPGAWDFYGPEVEFSHLPRPAQHVLAALEFEAEVNNGGISQYFFNSAGDHWPIALEGFGAMQCPNLARILEQSAAALGPQGPSLDRNRRIKQYAKLDDQKERELLDGLSSEFFKDPDHLNVQIARYMVQHAEAMKAAAALVSTAK